MILVRKCNELIKDEIIEDAMIMLEKAEDCKINKTKLIFFAGSTIQKKLKEECRRQNMAIASSTAVVYYDENEIFRVAGVKIIKGYEEYLGLDELCLVDELCVSGMGNKDIRLARYYVADESL